MCADECQDRTHYGSEKGNGEGVMGSEVNNGTVGFPLMEHQ
jgi:hypothetical protein